ncbi:MAG: S1/P1 nuclease [Gemmatimonadales bacterium]
MEAWAGEAWRIAKARAYPDAIQGSRLEDGYARPNLEVAVTQLARSALRLAALLNRALDPPTTPGGSGLPR